MADFQKNISELIASTKKPKRVKKPRYIKPESLKELERLEFDFRYKNSILPFNARVKNNFRDDTANGLTKCILAYLKLKGAFASRINTTGVYRPELKKFIPTTQKKGLTDIIGTYKGYSLHIEVKVGRDTMSDAQLKVQKEVETSGGLYFIARNFTDFKQWFENTFKISGKI